MWENDSLNTCTVRNSNYVQTVISNITVLLGSNFCRLEIQVVNHENTVWKLIIHVTTVIIIYCRKPNRNFKGNLNLYISYVVPSISVSKMVYVGLSQNKQAHGFSIFRKTLEPSEVCYRQIKCCSTSLVFTEYCQQSVDKITFNVNCNFI